MNCQEVEQYWKAITVIEASEALVNARVALVPKMRKDSLDKFVSELQEKANIKKKEACINVGSFADLASFL